MTNWWIWPRSPTRRRQALPTVQARVNNRTEILMGDNRNPDCKHIQAKPPNLALRKCIGAALQWELSCVFAIFEVHFLHDMARLLSEILNCHRFGTKLAPKQIPICENTKSALIQRWYGTDFKHRILLKSGVKCQSLPKCQKPCIWRKFGICKLSLWNGAK